jgi:DHA1 family bicyclomycin/chloramphenicol resistance-like MFS transporter
MTSDTGAGQPIVGKMGFKEFVGMIAAIMAVNAVAIDSMIPALAIIGDALAIPTENGRQWIITAYLLGFGVSQLFYGVLADHYGRKPVLLVGFGIYVVFSIVAALATSFEMMMVARVVQGVGSAAARVLAVSIVRDRFSGRQMARVMSLALIVFLAVPILAPSIGQLIMLVAPWRWIFGALAFFGAAVMVWIALRLPETMHPEDRAPLSPHGIIAAFKTTLTDRVALGYMSAMAIAMGGLFGFINSAQQVFVDVFDAGTWLTTIFALIAGAMAAASLLNSKIVGRLGTRRVSHTALLGYIAVALVHTIVTYAGYESLWTFAIFQAGLMFCFGLIGPNFGSMAMEPMGHVAGTASSVQGFFTTVVSTVLGFLIGQSFDHTIKPMLLGFVGLGIAALVIVLITEKGRLFRPTSSGIATASKD